MARVLLVHQPIEGGVARHVADLARGLDGAGHEVILCGPSRLDGLPESCGHVELALQRAVTPMPDARAVRRLGAIIEAMAPDVVHAHSSKAGAVARMARALRSGVPVIYSPHGYAFAGHFDLELERRAYRLIERALAPLASRVLCVCAAEGRLAAEVGRADRVRVAYNGVKPISEPLGADPVMVEAKRSGPVIGALTQLRPGKGLETLLDAMVLVLRRHPQAQLVVWGDGPDLGDLQSRSRALGICDHVRFPGSTTDPVRVLAGADVVAFPSLAEAFPYVILEAMSAARPIVASDVGGIAEALGGGSAGVLVPPADSPALAQALAVLLDDPDRARALASTAHDRVVTEFTVDNMLSGVLNVYRELVPSLLDASARSSVQP